MKTFFIKTLFAATLLAPVAYADDAHHKKSSAGATAPAAEMTEGEVRRVDKEAKKITLRHGPIASLDMPAMSMVFQVRDAAMLDQVKTGDKVKFRAEKVDGAYIITKIKPAN